MMKLTVCGLTNSIVYIIAAAFFLAGLAGPATLDASPGKLATVADNEVSAPDGFAVRFSTHTKMLHDKLEITPLQESLWNNLTMVMQENIKTMEALIQLRSNRETAMTALEDLKSYYEIASIQAEGLKKFISAFEALYVNMSPDQQKNADILFQIERGKTTVNKSSANPVFGHGVPSAGKHP